MQITGRSVYFWANRRFCRKRVNAISHYGYMPGHRQAVNDAVLVEEGDRLLRVGEAVRLVYLEVLKD